MNRHELPSFLYHPGVISVGLWMQVKKSKTESQLLDIIQNNPDKVHGILLNLDPTRITQTLVSQLVQKQLLDIDEEFQDIYNCNPPTFRQYTKNFDDSLLLYIEQDVDKKIEYIKSIKSSEEMFRYIQNNPAEVHLCMVWSSWESFNFELIFNLVDNGLLDVNQSNPAYDTDRDKNISFKRHCNLLLKETPKSSRHYSNLYTIANFF